MAGDGRSDSVDKDELMRGWDDVLDAVDAAERMASASQLSDNCDAMKRAQRVGRVALTTS